LRIDAVALENPGFVAVKSNAARIDRHGADAHGRSGGLCAHRLGSGETTTDQR
jgi:hypothetical protein